MAAVVSALHRKLVRDLLRLKGQVLTIALVVAAGIASFVALQGNYASLDRARLAFYDRQHFADVFATLERAPHSLEAEIESIPGVEVAQTRVVQPITLPETNVPEPIRATLVALPKEGDERLNAVVIRDGRRPDPNRADEVLVLHDFARAQRLGVGDRLIAILDGKRLELRIAGTAVSPEYVFGMSGGAFSSLPDRFAVVWMNPDSLAAASGMQGAFNAVAIALQPGASRADVLSSLDSLLERYGGAGAFARDRQPSDRALQGELDQLRAMSTIVPAIFLLVSCLLAHLVLSRLVQLQQPEIATLKALGYSNAQVGVHFLEIVLVVSALGVVIGVVSGAWLGAEMVELYARYFRFPDLAFHLSAKDAVLGAAISLLAAVTGAFSAVRRVVRLPPAEAMRPPTPAKYRRSLVDRLGLNELAGPSVQMIVRELERRPLRAVTSAAAIAASTGLSVVAAWYWDGIDALVQTQFEVVMREDAAVTFVEPRPERAVRELAHLPQVLVAEGLRVVPVHFHAGHHVREGLLWGYPEATEMRTLRDKLGRRVGIPPDGVVLTDVLAEVLDVHVGDTIDVEVEQGRRKTVKLVVTGLVDESFGLQGHMDFEALHRALAEQPAVSLALLRLDQEATPEFDARLRKLPLVAEVTRRSSLLQHFQEQSASMIRTVSLIVALFAATITVGVAYNNARIALAMRGRDLASLRVLGFTRGEISGILLGELALAVLVALPFGFVAGRWLVFALAGTVDPETYRMPIILNARSYAFAALVTVVSAILSGLVVRRRIDRLDLIGVLKTRE